MDEQGQPGTVVGPTRVPDAPVAPPTQPSYGESSLQMPPQASQPTQISPTPITSQDADYMSPQPLQATPPLAPPPSLSHAGQPAERFSDAAFDYGQGAISWQANEFELTSKNSTWYGSVTLAAILGAIITFFLTGKDWFVAAAVLFAILGLAYLASRKPSLQTYAIDENGVYIGNRLHQYQKFRYFSVNEVGNALNLNFTPLKRFAPPVVIQLLPQYEQAAIELLSMYLPMEEHKPDAIDSLLKRIKL